MPDHEKLNRPWLVAAWPGMGHVAVSASYYLMAKLGMYQMAELSAEGLFDVECVDVKDGIIRTTSLPRSRFFVWRDPEGFRDIVVFIGEAQPPQGKYAFCRRLVGFAKELGVEQIFTFAAMATQMHPDHESRVFCAATDDVTLSQLRKVDLQVLRDGNIGGLNGILLGAVAEAELHGACLLGEMPHIFAQLPYPKASAAVLRAFLSLSNVDLDLTELDEQAKAVDEKLGELLAKVEQSMAHTEVEEQPPPFEAEPISAEDKLMIERLFERAEADRANAYELKRELDRLGLFDEYEDRFLDLFKRPD